MSEPEGEWGTAPAPGRRQGIPMEECVDRRLYRINGRNMGYGIFCAEKKGFFGLRHKFQLRLEHEYHNDCGPPYGTVFGPMTDTGIDLPETIPNLDMLGSRDSVTGRWVIWDMEMPNPNESAKGKSGWYRYKDNNDPCPARPGCNVAIIGNMEMFNWLIERERAFADYHFEPRECSGCKEQATEFDPCSCSIDFEFGSRCRRCWRPADGWECEVCDAEVIEARKKRFEEGS